jgi:hypothetical protein
MKITRVLEGERYTAPDEGLGYLSVVADEDGFEVEQDGHVFWVSDARLDDAVEARNRAVKHNGVDIEPVVSELEGVLARYDVPGDAMTCTDCHRTVRVLGEDAWTHDSIPGLVFCTGCFALRKEGIHPRVRMVEQTDRCGRCRRPGSVGPCSFDCATCYGCKKSLEDGEVRLVTTLDRVYCMDCGTRA